MASVVLAGALSCVMLVAPAASAQNVEVCVTGDTACVCVTGADPWYGCDSGCPASAGLARDTQTGVSCAGPTAPNGFGECVVGALCVCLFACYDSETGNLCKAGVLGIGLVC